MKDVLSVIAALPFIVLFLLIGFIIIGGLICMCVKPYLEMVQNFKDSKKMLKKSSAAQRNANKQPRHLFLSVSVNATIIF